MKHTKYFHTPKNFNFLTGWEETKDSKKRKNPHKTPSEVSSRAANISISFAAKPSINAMEYYQLSFDDGVA